MKKKITLVVALALVLVVGVFGTLAWLTDTTGDVVNTFTVGKVQIDLKETATNFKMVPGEVITKDPVATVKANSEKCYLFVKVAEDNGVADYIAYSVASSWTKLEDGVYYQVVEASEDDQSFAVLTDDKVTVKNTVTSEMMEKAAEQQPTLTFTAYAIQYAGFENDASAAWIEVSKAG